MANRWEKCGNCQISFPWAPKQCSDCSHKIKRLLLLGRIVLTNLDSVLKSRHHFSDKGPYSESYGFSSSHLWTWDLDIKKVDRQRIDAIELWFWRGLLRVPWTARRSNLSILKEINPEDSMGGLILKLKLQYFGYLMQRAGLLEKTLMLGQIEGKRRRGQQRMTWLDSIIDSIWANSGRQWRTEAWHAAVNQVIKGHTNLVTEQQHC